MSNTLLGGAVGDALGMPFESKLANDPLITNWDRKTFLSSPHHGLTAGQWTDDTQFSLCVAQSLIDSHGFNPDDISKRYVDLFESKTIRGYGRTTLMAIQALQNGKHWSESGVPNSYGNGTAMRAAPFGIYFRNDLRSLIEIVKIDSAITHASPEAEAGALSIALANYFIVNDDTDDMLDRIHDHLPDSMVKKNVSQVETMVQSKATHQDILKIIGTRADVRMTVPAALYLYLKFENYEEAIVAGILAGGDTDTTCAVLGAMIGTRDGIKGIPKEWSDVIENRDELIVLDNQLYGRNNQNLLKVKS